MRQCVVCKTQKPKKELLRVVKFEDKDTGKINFSLDFTGKMSGRGAYLCNQDDCVLKAIKNRVFNRVFEMQINDEVYTKLLSEYESRKNS